MKNTKYWKRRFSGQTSGDAGPYHRHLDLRRIDDLDDTGLAYLLTGVKGIDMLDLHETDITNDSIRLLTSLEYVKELGLKGCYKLNDDCIKDLDRIKGLELLHVKDASITIDGLLQLSPHPALRQLMFSAESPAAIPEKINRLKNLFPGCELVINSVPYG